MTYVVWKDGKPFATNDKAEANRLRKRMEAVITVLESMGYSNVPDNWNNIVSEMAQTDFKKYMEFLDKVKERS